jgi:hypothetical protein
MRIIACGVRLIGQYSTRRNIALETHSYISHTARHSRAVTSNSWVVQKSGATIIKLMQLLNH